MADRARVRRNFELMEQRRLQAAQLLEQGVRPSEVARQVGVHRQSVSRWARQLQRAGPSALKKADHAGRKPRLNAENWNEIKAQLQRRRAEPDDTTGHSTVKRMSHVIEERYGIRYHPGHVWRIMRRLGWRPLPRYPKLQRSLRNTSTDELVGMMLAYRDKPTQKWSNKDWILLDALDHLLTKRAASSRACPRYDMRAQKDPHFWEWVDEQLEFYYEARFPGEDGSER